MSNEEIIVARIAGLMMVGAIAFAMVSFGFHWSLLCLTAGTVVAGVSLRK